MKYLRKFNESIFYGDGKYKNIFDDIKDVFQDVIDEHVFSIEKVEDHDDSEPDQYTLSMRLEDGKFSIVFYLPITTTEDRQNHIFDQIMKSSKRLESMGNYTIDSVDNRTGDRIIVLVISKTGFIQLEDITPISRQVAVDFYNWKTGTDDGDKFFDDYLKSIN